MSWWFYFYTFCASLFTKKSEELKQIVVFHNVTVYVSFPCNFVMLVLKCLLDHAHNSLISTFQVLAGCLDKDHAYL